MYRLFAADGALLYIGSAYDPDRRCKSHEKKPWWPQVARRTEEWHPSRGHAYIEEMKAITAEGSKYNAMGAPGYIAPQTEAVIRRNELSRQRGIGQARSYRIRVETAATLRSEGVSFAVADKAGALAALAYLEGTGLFRAHVERERKRMATTE